MSDNYTITGYTLRVAVIYQDRQATWKTERNLWREFEHVVGPDYGGGPNFLSEEHQEEMIIRNARACAAVLNKHETDAEGKPMWNGLQAIGATVIGYGANIRKETP